jgi:hypothetical protein
VGEKAELNVLKRAAQYSSVYFTALLKTVGLGRYVTGRYVTGRYVTGLYVTGRYVTGRYVTGRKITFHFLLVSLQK